MCPASVRSPWQIGSSTKLYWTEAAQVLALGRTATADSNKKKSCLPKGLHVAVVDLAGAAAETALCRSYAMGPAHDVAATRASTLLTYCHGRTATYAGKQEALRGQRKTRDGGEKERAEI
jgi:hypothetical protein